MSCWSCGSILVSNIGGGRFEPFYCNDKYSIFVTEFANSVKTFRENSNVITGLGPIRLIQLKSASALCHLVGVTNSSLENPRATMVRSFHNKLSTSKKKK